MHRMGRVWAMISRHAFWSWPLPEPMSERILSTSTISKMQGHKDRSQIRECSTNRYLSSLFPSTIHHLNSLPEDIIKHWGANIEDFRENAKYVVTQPG